MEAKSQQGHYNCNYKGCKAIADYNSKLGKYCAYHLKVLRKKMGNDFKAEKIELTSTQKKMIKMFRLNPKIQLNFIGGKK